MAARKYSRKRTTKRRSVKSKRTGGALTTKAAVLRTAYARAVLNPRTGPLVGVPQFVPIATHVVRTRAIGDFHARGGSFSLLFNPMSMVANDQKAIQVFKGAVAVGDVPDSTEAPSTEAEFQAVPADGLTYAFKSNVDYDASAFENEGLKARVVGAVVRVCNTSNSHLRDGVFTCLHERHHHSLEDETTTTMAAQNNSIIKPAGDGSWVGLLYRAVRPQEIEEWQTAPGVLAGDIRTASGNDDGAINDMNPGYMRINWTGSGAADDAGLGQSFHVEAYAIIEYAGESVTTLVRHTNKGAGSATAAMTGEVGDGARAREQSGQGTDDLDVHDRIEQIKQNIESHVESAHEEFGDPEATRVLGSSTGAAYMKWSRTQPPTSSSVHDLASLESAEISNLAYVAHESGANVEVMHDVLANAPDHLKHMRDWEVKFVGNGNKDIILHDPVSGRFHVGYAGTTGANAGDAGVQWFINNPMLAAGAETSQRAVGAQRTADIAVEMAGDLTKVKLHGHSQGGALAIRNAQRTGVAAHVQNPLIPAKDVLEGTKTAIRIDRVQSDVVSWNSFLADKANLEHLPVSSSGKVSVQTVGLKGGYSKAFELTRPKETSTAFNSHSLDNFRYTNDEVLGVGAKGVEVSRYSRFATVGKVLGELYTASLVVGDAMDDVDEVAGTKAAPVKAVGMVATDVAAELGNVAVVTGATVSGAAAGEAIGMALGEAVGAVAGPLGMVVAGAAGAVIGAEATTVIDWGRKHIKHWIKHWFD